LPADVPAHGNPRLRHSVDGLRRLRIHQHSRNAAARGSALTPDAGAGDGSQTPIKGQRQSRRQPNNRKSESCHPTNSTYVGWPNAMPANTPLGTKPAAETQTFEPGNGELRLQQSLFGQLLAVDAELRPGHGVQTLLGDGLAAVA